ncbi:MAG: NAD(P)H-hydrate epimerase [Methanobacteriota archaeon]|nr:MAG: NAD(P)H-hydrate epimerase [Euryarchaeota archaeon]
MIQQFVTEDGIIVPAATVKQMQEIDRIAMEETGPNLFQMMENAGRNLALMAMKLLNDYWQEGHYLILAGSGGNGGGGICAARHLVNRGLNVSLCLSNPERLKEVTAFQFQLYQNAGGKVIAINELPSVAPDIVIDALIGYSLRGAPAGNTTEMLQWANSCTGIKLALDVPSGVDATSGEKSGLFFQAECTLTLALPKTGLYPHHTGKLYLGDIGIPSSVYRKLGIRYTPPFGNQYIVELQVPTLAQGNANQPTNHSA